jgi:hypothetical protein
MALKRTNQKQSSTIDEKHTEMLQTFDLIETNKIPKLLEERSKLKVHLKNLTKDSNQSSHIDEIMEVRDKIRLLK